MNSTSCSTAALIRRRDVARMLSVSERTITNWTIHGIIPSIAIGGTRRYDAQAVMVAVHKANEAKARTAGKVGAA